MSVEILTGDCRKLLTSIPTKSVNTCVTSPPYWGLRDYGHPGQIGQEQTPQEYVKNLVAIFREVRRTLRNDGTLWLNIGDSSANDGKWGGETGGKQHYLGEANRARVGREKRITGLKPKDMVGIPWRLAFALQEDGWWLRCDIIWAKPNCMPESVKDRPTRSHEYLFLLAKCRNYYYDGEAIKEPMSMSSVKRLSQDVENQAGSERAHAGEKTNGTMKAVGGKQSGHSRRHDGFNDRWDKMEREEQCSGMRNKRDVWTVAPANYKEAHFATFPPKLIRPCILAGCPVGGTVLDPFGGSGTTGAVAEEEGRNSILLELNPEYVGMAKHRTAQKGLFTS